MIKIIMAVRVVAAMVAVMTLSGCASIISESNYPVSISSDPIGAITTVSNVNGAIVYKGMTPQTIFLRAAEGDYTISFELNGVHAHQRLEKKFDWWVLGNGIFGPIGGGIGGLIDNLTGSDAKLDGNVFYSFGFHEAPIAEFAGQINAQRQDKRPDK